MKIQQLFFPFSSNAGHLKKKWWHRFFIVAYAIIIFVSAVFTLLIAYVSIPESESNIAIVSNLDQHIASGLGNTETSFLKQEGELGCLNKDGSIGYISRYSFEDKIICSAKMSVLPKEELDRMSRDEQVSYIRSVLQGAPKLESLGGDVGDQEQVDQIELTRRFAENEPGPNKAQESMAQSGDADVKSIARVHCFVGSEINCGSEAIILYRKGLLLYAESLIGSILMTYIVSIILQLVYYKGLIYIIYGGGKSSQ